MSYIFEHTRLGFCWWDLLALVILVIVVVAFAVKRSKLKDDRMNWKISYLNCMRKIQLRQIRNFNDVGTSGRVYYC